ncbi:nicotianamine aminotransferase 1-like [Actinidia eriantha]|uniref:nicotianamine aminotransferase 1-like n=1 Tax=Actinidia eriantha TaxID=165200 RepID=UPI0025880EE6|nr:nicotianamine aminotransferase 1-like [Actinidia eriantha]
MANGSSAKWDTFQGKEERNAASGITVRSVLEEIMENLNPSDQRAVVPLGHGDPSAFPCFRTTAVAEDAIVQAVRSAKFNCYAPPVGIEPARRSIAEHLSCDLPYKLSPDDVYLTVGANHAIEVLITALARPGANILAPRPGYPLYEARAAFSNLEVRHFDLISEKGWEVDLDSVEALANDKTIAMVIINPGNPCGNILTFNHMKKIAETARKLGILVIADEVYDHLAFGSNPFVPMGVFGSITPVLTLGSISKRWIVPGWRLGWIVTADPSGILQKSWIVESLKSYLNITADPTTFVQGALPQIIKETTEDFFLKITNMLREAADMCYDGLKEIHCITCPHKPEGSMSTMVKLNLSFLEDISDDMDFCIKLAKEESVIVLPGFAVGLKNWLRITFAVEPSMLEDALWRIKAFYLRHAKKQ